MEPLTIVNFVLSLTALGDVTLFSGITGDGVVHRLPEPTGDLGDGGCVPGEADVVEV